MARKRYYWRIKLTHLQCFGLVDKKEYCWHGKCSRWSTSERSRYQLSRVAGDGGQVETYAGGTGPSRRLPINLAPQKSADALPFRSLAFDAMFKEKRVQL